MKKALAGAILTALALTGPAAMAKDEEKEGTSPEHDYYTYMESSGPITFLVYSYAAHWRWDDPYFPLQIAVGVAPLKKEKAIQLSLGDFQLIDQEGDTYDPPPYATLIKDYQHLSADQQYLNLRPINVDMLFQSYSKNVGAFYPVSGGLRLRTGEVELPAASYYVDIIYFPHPQNGLDGVLSLQLSDPSLESPIEVKFRVPPRKEHKDHKAEDHKE